MMSKSQFSDKLVKTSTVREVSLRKQHEKSEERERVKQQRVFDDDSIGQKMVYWVGHSGGGGWRVEGGGISNSGVPCQTLLPPKSKLTEAYSEHLRGVFTPPPCRGPPPATPKNVYT